MKIGITGADGLLGWHLSCHLKGIKDIQIFRADRSYFSDIQKLNDFVQNCDVIVHFAGMNRGDDQVIYDTNIELTKKLLEACQSSKQRHHFIFSSSTHIYKGTLYGKSKQECTRLFREYAKQTGSAFTNLILPHIFGEGGKPYYNSAIATFCHQISKGEQTQIIHDSELELLHAGKVADLIYNVIKTGAVDEIVPNGYKILVSEVLKKLKDFDSLYKAQITPCLREEVDLQLFNTYRSYLYPDYYPVELKLHSDTRGSLFEVTKGYSENQVFISTTHPGIIRGNHFHLKKIERFCVLQGEAKVRIRRLYSDEIKEFHLSGNQPNFVDIPTLHTHHIENVGGTSLLTLFWANEIFNSLQPDTYFEPVQLDK